MIDGWGISCDIALRWMSLDLTDDESILVQVMAWCRQATSHYLSQCWPRYLSPYGVTRPQWVNHAQSDTENQELSWYQLWRPRQTLGCHDDNLQCHQWRRSWHHDDSRIFSEQASVEVVNAYAWSSNKMKWFDLKIWQQESGTSNGHWSGMLYYPEYPFLTEWKYHPPFFLVTLHFTRYLRRQWASVYTIRTIVAWCLSTMFYIKYSIWRALLSSHIQMHHCTNEFEISSLEREERRRNI